MANLGWKGLLREWMRLFREHEGNDEDVAYWYGERALTGLLSAAAWKVQYWWALEEFVGKRTLGKSRFGLN